ncbi:16S rRNA (cytosine(1402)-N(4))-methyltransferase, partial [Patescibacteria group bacterium]|nr:16S rRNA (cytosine(1402)-N(4))-methyltransferase [Patescibacteria group bacterium]
MHIPVLQKEVIQFLEPKPNENFIDCTIGEAGHTAAILERNKPDGKVLGIEIDPELYKKLKSRMAEFSIFPDFIEDPRWQSHRDNFQFSNRLVLANDSYANLKRIVEREKFGKVSGILFDLGMSSWHLEKSGRGFSFQRNERLDMRYQGLERDRRGTGEGQSPKNPQKTAEEIVNN